LQQEPIDYNQLLIALKAFDPDAFNTLYIHSRERLFAYAFSILKDEEAARDLVQDLFIHFWENKIFLQVHTGLAAYLVRSIRNRALDHQKKAHTQQKLQNNLYHIEGGKFVPDDKMITEELGQQLETAMSKLPSMPAKVFRLHYIEKLSYADIADQLQISPATISNHMTKALKILRQELRKND
jgi:RNA polymerase sigma-70 factor, ECF subfamily